ncbi:MAG: AAA family ATPase [Eubacteriales bacterium]|nr:AAA family ATPase [Eubacteriales bacterium]MDD3882826.1 AAA family ATPase [Eubacteriales bacterium]MDD4513276.1 AAA family ATPase [Eubacteriales bacterium]
MIYLESITLPNEDAEWKYRMSVQRTCYNTIYPFYTIIKTGLERLDFAPITILYGGNGCGKTSVLNVIAEKLMLRRSTPYNRSNFFSDYVNLCKTSIENDIPDKSRIITSDDVFEYMLDLRRLNDGIDSRKEELFSEWYDSRHSRLRVRSLDDYDSLKKQNAARRSTQSAFVREQVMDNVREQSNGESAIFYFRQRIEADALYLLDEPENSLCAERQTELAEYLEESARYIGCQLIIATHSPFLLAMRGAKIYDLDASPATIRKWTELKNVREYYDFFKNHDGEFE